MPAKEQEEYEIVPISPLRRLEKRIEQLEATSSSTEVKEFLKEMFDLVRMNQQIVTELSKADDAMRLELAKLAEKVQELVDNIGELLSYIKAAATEEMGRPQEVPVTSGLAEKMNELVEQNKKILETNQSVISVLEEIERKLRRPPLLAPVRKPLQP